MSRHCGENMCRTGRVASVLCRPYIVETKRDKPYCSTFEDISTVYNRSELGSYRYDNCDQRDQTGK